MEEETKLIKYDLRSVFSKLSEGENKGLEILIKQAIRQDETTARCFPTRFKPETERTEHQARKASWKKVLEIIERKSNPQVFSWFTPLKALVESEKSLALEASSEFDRDWINNNYMGFIKEAVEELYGDAVELKIVSPLQQPQDREDQDTTLQNTFSHGKESAPKGGHKKRDEGHPKLNPNYSFDRFIVGPSNQFPHAASVAVATNPGKAYNPLFIHGGVGLGKTHLLNAIGNYIKSSQPNARICCISAESFTNQMINSIKSNRMEEFRSRYRFGCDVLLIDDVQFIAGKESTQEEFFHTFNTLYESKKQIALTSDKSPKDMSYLEERLRSRFEWGLITDIQPPETETRTAIIKNKTDSERVAVSDEVALYLAKNTSSNVRELEGMLTNIIARARLLNTEISLELAKDVLKTIVKKQEKKPLTIEFIQGEVAKFYGLKISELKSERKQKNIIQPRQTAMYLARKCIGASYPEIGEKFGGKDHSTVIHAVKKIEKNLAEDHSLAKTLDFFSQKFETLTQE